MANNRQLSTEITEDFRTIVYGNGKKAINRDLGGTAIAIGEDVEAHALGEYGTAVTIGYGDCCMAAGLGGKLVWIMPVELNGPRVWSATVDGVRIKPGRLYIVSMGTFEEVDDENAKAVPTSAGEAA